MKNKSAKTIAIIPARKNSKGLPNKNILNLCGKPLISHSIELALKCNLIDITVVSSDSDAVRQIVNDYNDNSLRFISRPDELSRDDSKSIDLVRHACDLLIDEGVTLDKIILLQPTSPIRTLEILNNAIQIFIQNNLFSLVSVSNPIQHPSDFINIQGDDKEYLCRKELAYRRQDFDRFKFINGSIYITNYDYLREFNQIYDVKSTFLFDMPVEYSIDIDTAFDFKVCELLLNELNNSKNFKIN